jgi:hypothetical protein
LGKGSEITPADKKRPSPLTDGIKAVLRCIFHNNRAQPERLRLNFPLNNHNATPPFSCHNNQKNLLSPLNPVGGGFLYKEAVI